MVDWDTVSYVIRSDYRRRVLETLYAGKDTPSNIASKTDIYLSHVSTALKQLREKELVERLVDSPKGRIYSLTEKGENVAETIEGEDL
jgi:predicted transcriptional regulator